MGKHILQVLQWHRPYKDILLPESHQFPQYSKTSIASEFFSLAEYLLIPASFEQPTHHLYI